MNTPSSDLARVAALAESHRAEIVDLVQRLVRTPSVTGTENALGGLLSAFFDDRQWPVEWSPLARSAASGSQHFSAERDLETRGNTTGWYRSRTGRPVVTVNVHIDTVPVVDREDWSTDPFGGERRSGRIYGRGAVDTKGGGAAALFALQVLDELNAELPFDLAVELVAAEESTGLGTTLTLEERPARLGTIVVEPTGNDVVIANSGVLFFTIEVDGHAAHTSQPWRGVNAIEKGVRVWQELQALGARREAEQRHALMDSEHSAVPLVVGTLRGGGFRAAVPSHVTMSGRVGVLPGESLEAVRQQMRDAIATASVGDDWLQSHPVRLLWDHEGAPGWEVAHDLSLVAAMESAQALRAFPTTARGLTSGCDAGIINDQGIPVVVFGPGDMALAHSVDEYVEENDVVEACALLAAALLDLGARLADAETASETASETGAETGSETAAEVDATVTGGAR